MPRVTLVLDMPDDPQNVGGLEFDWRFALATERAKVVAVRDGDAIAELKEREQEDDEYFPRKPERASFNINWTDAKPNVASCE